MNSKQDVAGSVRQRQWQKLAVGWCALALFIVCTTFESFSQTNAVRTNEAKSISTQRGQSHRYLFVVETSSSMRRRAEAVQHVVGDMLISGMGGQLRTGDSIGIWTFDEQLHAGQFPLQRWTPENRQRIAAAAVLFLSKQSYQKSGRLTEMMPQVERLVKGSGTLTVILVSSGDEKLIGTPFDVQVNASFEKDRRAQQRAQMPFVTVLRAKAGEFTDYRINLAPWPVEFPPLPPEPKIEVAEVKPAPAPPPQPQVVPPLIISGKKSNQVEATATPAPPSEKPVPPLPTTTTEPVPARTETSQLIVTETKPAAEPVVTVGETKKPGADATPPTTSPPTADTSPSQPGPSENPSAPAATPPANARSVASTSPVESVATPAPSPFQGKAPLIIGCLLFIAAALVWFAMSRRARARAAHRASLITRSLDQREP